MITHEDEQRCDELNCRCDMIVVRICEDGGGSARWGGEGGRSVNLAVRSEWN